MRVAKRVAVVRSSRTPTTALGVAVCEQLRAAGHHVTEVAVTAGDSVDLCESDVAILLSPEHPSLHSHHGGWREWDRWHATTVPWLTSVARAAHTRRLVLQSSALVYADSASTAVDERSPVGVTRATEPWCAAETAVNRFAASGPRSAVVLRVAPLVDDPAVTPWLAAAAARPGTCPQVRWHPMAHIAEAADAFVRAVHVSPAVYNVGCSQSGPHAIEPGRSLAGRFFALPPVGQLLPWRARVDDRLEPFCRSIRLDAQRFAGITGWAPRSVSISNRG